MPDTQPQTAPQQPDLTGRTLGDFHILRRIGAGGMGQVYLARQTSLKREVALKLLRDELNANLTALARFQAEAQAVAKLNHPNIVHIHQIGESDGVRYMVLEFVEGRNLRDYLARKGPPDLPIALSVVRQVTLALQKAHEQGIVHRDIKPENILVTRKVEVKVTDFGLSRFFAGETPATNITQSGVTLGTPLYMSPEQVQGHAVDHRSDIYSFGVTCFHLLAGEPPFRGTSAFDVSLKHVQEQPRRLADLRPDLPADLCGMVHKMMAKKPEERYQSARDVLRDLMKVRDSLTTGTAQFSLSQNTGKVRALSTAGDSSSLLAQTPVSPSGHRTRWGQWLLIGAACALAAIGGVFLYAGTNPSADAAHAPPSVNNSGPGLPDVRSPDRLNTTRERELLVVLNTEGTKPDDAIKASVELGLLYVKERRLPEANERFERLRGREREWRDLVAARTAGVAGRLGLAVVLAHENKPEPSNKLFLDVAQDQPKFGGPGMPKFERPTFSVSGTLLRYPDLSHAVSDALNRNATNLGKTRLEPAVLEQLRSPQRVGK
ncbi:serine threonine protein kinase : Putative serine/threonine protein kinase OS=Gemmata sp. Wa1-1 PE=4 SV=1: Pkinase [Gemmata massiliana]|uniref:non-specific serine/threonine protein kinase n=1 Tax=Gemmata massiliana TaxID=1210884 RepID=A0A6P2DCX8_9BACT|nr:serine/threonine-protein kinase [Gemmata massiliana]VTR98698.1 serine threonine protein kinase : Putative serine/threonine protein kinase OS=Gemmata sp. Wa1-1 PE=4 SV=1: Pkinase [Gemmata massiliana]